MPPGGLWGSLRSAQRRCRAHEGRRCPLDRAEVQGLYRTTAAKFPRVSATGRESSAYSVGTPRAPDSDTSNALAIATIGLRLSIAARRRRRNASSSVSPKRAMSDPFARSMTFRPSSVWRSWRFSLKRAIAASGVGASSAGRRGLSREAITPAAPARSTKSSPVWPGKSTTGPAAGPMPCGAAGLPTRPAARGWAASCESSRDSEERVVKREADGVLVLRRRREPVVLELEDLLVRLVVTVLESADEPSPDLVLEGAGHLPQRGPGA